MGFSTSRHTAIAAHAPRRPGPRGETAPRGLFSRARAWVAGASTLTLGQRAQASVPMTPAEPVLLDEIHALAAVVGVILGYGLHQLHLTGRRRYTLFAMAGTVAVVLAFVPYGLYLVAGGVFSLLLALAWDYFTNP